MTSYMISGPTFEPIDPMDVIINEDANDLLLRSFIAAARLQIEGSLGLVICAQRWRKVFHNPNDWLEPSSKIKLPLHPIISIDSVKVGTLLLNQIAGNPHSQIAMVNTIEVDYTVGFGDRQDLIPGDIKREVVRVAQALAAGDVAIILKKLKEKYHADKS